MKLNYLILLLVFSACSFNGNVAAQMDTPEPIVITPGAYHLEEYLHLLKEKKVALVVNQTSEINGVLLPDTLLQLGINIVKIFSPEHGFRGDADAGAQVKDGKDGKTGLPVISLYGKNKKPSAAQLNGVDIVVYDLQDVGVRFYTYISTLQYIMEACAENKTPVMILDRPNPLGHIVDGPILNKKFKSFVGLQPIPVIYGMTPAEYAKMLIGEKWLESSAPELHIISCKNYTHNSLYHLPVAPSPNLKNMAAIYLYPSLCFFEGTIISVGRGTDIPFQQFGHPSLTMMPDTFRPMPMKGASEPKLKGRLCYGKKIAVNQEDALRLADDKLNIEWLLTAYKHYPQKEQFFNNFFNNLAGQSELKQQIVAGKTEAEIRASWQKDLNVFKEIRMKYLIYPKEFSSSK